MNRGPAPGSTPRDERSFVEKATEAYAGSLPDWVLALAEYTDQHRLKGAAAKIGYSTTAVSNVLNNKYALGDVARVEQAVRGALLGLTVECPVLGELSRTICLQWQAKPRAATSSLRAQMYRACHGGCPHFRSKGGSDADPQ